MTDHKYKYSRTPPNNTRGWLELPHVLGHNIGQLRRRDMLKPETVGVTQVYCSCGWKDPRWLGGRRQAFIQFEKHLVEVMKQGSLFDALS